MGRRLRRSCSLVAAPAAVAATALATSAPAHAAPPPSSGWETQSVLQGTVSWVRAGAAAGKPGNAHSGELLLVSDEPYVSTEAYDWSCPRGVVPPTQLDTSGRCDLLASTVATPVDIAPDVAYGGPLGVRLSGTWDVAHARWSGGQQGPVTHYQRTVRADVVQVGPLHRTVTDVIDDGYETQTTTSTARVELRGYVPEVTLPTSRDHQSSSWTRTTVRTRPVG